jgi:hypothetical protein
MNLFDTAPLLKDQPQAFTPPTTDIQIDAEAEFTDAFQDLVKQRLLILAAQIDKAQDQEKTEFQKLQSRLLDVAMIRQAAIAGGGSDLSRPGGNFPAIEEVENPRLYSIMVNVYLEGNKITGYLAQPIYLDSRNTAMLHSGRKINEKVSILLEHLREYLGQLEGAPPFANEGVVSFVLCPRTPSSEALPRNRTYLGQVSGKIIYVAYATLNKPKPIIFADFRHDFTERSKFVQLTSQAFPEKQASYKAHQYACAEDYKYYQARPTEYQQFRNLTSASKIELEQDYQQLLSNLDPSAAEPTDTQTLLAQRKQVIEQILQKAKLSKEWTPLSELKACQPLCDAIMQWYLYSSHVMDIDNKLSDSVILSRNVFVRAANRKLYAKKIYQADTKKDSLYKDLNNPLREGLAFYLGRRIQANVAEAVITPGATYSLLSVSTEPESLPQKRKETAEAAHLVFDVFTRRWDDSKAMIQRSPVGDTLVGFDNDQAFNSKLKWIDVFLAFIGDFMNFTEEKRNLLGGTWPIHWQAGDFDIDVIHKTIQAVKGLDIDQLITSFVADLPESFRRHQRTVEAQLKPISQLLKETKESIAGDVALAYIQLTGQNLSQDDSTTAADESQAQQSSLWGYTKAMWFALAAEILIVALGLAIKFVLRRMAASTVGYRQIFTWLRSLNIYHPYLFTITMFLLGHLNYVIGVAIIVGVSVIYFSLKGLAVEEGSYRRTDTAT